MGIERQGTPEHLFQYNGKEKQSELGLEWMDYGARMYDPQLGRFNTVDPMADIQEDFTPYHYVYNNPLIFTDPSGMLPEENQRITSTFVGPDGTILDHRNDKDPTVYFVNDVDAWEKGGKKKDGLAKVGWENPNYDYQIGSKYNGLDRRQNLLAPASGEANIDLTIESLFIPLARPIGWGMKWAGRYVLKLVNRGGKWVIEVVEQGTKRVVGSFAASRIQAGTLKEFKSLVTQLSKPGSALTQKELGQLEVLVKKYGGTLRYDLKGVKGTGVKPHVQVEGLGKSVESRHIWLGPGVQ